MTKMIYVIPLCVLLVTSVTEVIYEIFRKR